MQHLVDNRYRLVWTLGSGGMAEVYLAHDDVLGRDVALKVLSDRYADDEEFVERFRREAQNAAALSHPNIVSIFDRGQTEDGTYYIAMEYLPGGTLKERLEKSGPLQARRAAAVALQIARALRAAHDSGVVHGSLDPHSVLITESGNVKVKDFGIVRTSSSATSGAGSTPDMDHYLSPEQAAGEAASPKSDLYSLGVVLYEMLTGELPYDAEMPIGIAMNLVDGHRREPIEVDASVPKGVNAVVMGLIARNPEDRYADAGALIEDLERVSAGLEPVNAGIRKSVQAASHEAGGSRRAVRRQGEGRQRNLLLVMPLLAVLVLVGLAWTGLGLLQGSTQESQPEPRPEPQPVMLQVPDLEGITLEEARQEVGEDFDIVEDGRENSSRPGDTILNQEPSGGQAEKGSEIRAVVASGQNEVPAVENRPLEEARQALSDAGFEAMVTETESTAAQTGLVVSQEPASGSTADVGSEVEIMVGSGPALVEAPNLYGYTLDEAATVLESLGLALGGNDTAPSDEVAEGGIIAQSVAPGAGVEVGTAVGVTLSSGPESIPVPNVVGQSLNRAQQTIVNAGFYYDVLEVPNPQWPAGTVLYTDPETGTPLVPGSTVTIAYSSGPSRLQPPASAQNGRDARQARNRPASSP